MSRFARAFLCGLLLSAAPAFATGLPDTGQDTCYNDTAADAVAASDAASIARDAGTHPRQDCRYGRDPAVAAGALTKTGAGAKGFDYTKIANSGAAVDAGVALGTAAGDWACTRDNVTGLTWEVKTAVAGDLRHVAHIYTWYDSNAGTNGGGAGITGSNTCTSTLPGGQCNTQAYVAAVNAARLCGHADWRLPTPRELLTLVKADGSAPSIDSTLFPSTSAVTQYWTGWTYAEGTDLAWVVDFRRGSNPTGRKASAALAARLVRGGSPAAGTPSCTAGTPHANSPESTPTSAFTVHGDGTLTHQPTGLMWKQCPQGSSGTGCATGDAAALSWRDALAAAAADTTAGFHDWRLPNKKELESIIEFCGYYPALNRVVFPGTYGSTFWSGTTDATKPATAWVVFFYNGGSAPEFDGKSRGNFVRLVRGGQPPDPFDAAAPVFNYQGMWWNSPAGSESGWGINFAHQGDTIFATWFTFGHDGKPLWMVVGAPKTGPKVYSGRLFTGTGPAFDAVPFDPAKVVPVDVGSATFTFADDSHATFAYTVNGVSQSKTITREVFAAPMPACRWGAPPNAATATNYQDMWWASPAGSESGWGINFAQQGDTIFATWFTFGHDGKPLWLVAGANKVAANVYTGTLYTGTGPAFDSVPFDSSKIVPREAGTATLTFTDGNSATFAYNVDGVAQSKKITREVFAAPGTTCQ